MGKRAIIFDLDETLAPDHAAVDEAYLAACEVAAERADPAALAESARERARTLWRAGPFLDYCTGLGLASWEGLLGTWEGGDTSLARVREWVPGFRRAVWTSALAAHNVRDGALAEALAEAFQEERWARCEPYPDVVGALEDLGRDHALAMLTNGVPDIQRKKLEASGLDRFFPVTVVSGDVGVGKPDRRVFERVLGLLGARPDEAAMVGDSLERDIAGARGAGMFAVQIARHGQRRVEGVEPDAVIREMGELRRVLERASGG